MGLPLSEIEYAKFVMSDASPKGPGPSYARMILRATHAHDWKVIFMRNYSAKLIGLYHTIFKTLYIIVVLKCN
jgi:hypothetical protein